jgi:phosphatidylserine decarboxylase
MNDPLPLPENIRSVQPGGGFCYRVELAWGRFRRWYLATFRGTYVRQMAWLIRGDTTGAPHPILDPRDLKYCCNLCTAYFPVADDPFAWRDRLGFARWGLAEMQLMGWPLFALTVWLVMRGGGWAWLAVVPGVLLALVFWFFRDPTRQIPADPDAVVSPADGTVAEVVRLDHYDFFDGPAIRIGIFLSIFNVHVNRTPRSGRVLAMDYQPGRFLNAMNPESTLVNESLWIGCEDEERPGDKWAVRQISGLIARRIVCVLQPGQEVGRGEKFGMIKLGSRTELVLPAHAEVLVSVGDKVAGGSSIVARLGPAD